METCTHIPSFLAQAIDIYHRSTSQRVFQAFWQDSDVHGFEQDCDKLGLRLDIGANNCDRTLAEQDRGVLGQLQQELQNVLKEIDQIHAVQAKLARLERKVDLSRLRVVEGAIFDAYNQTYRGCRPATRVDLLATIHDWARRPGGKSIFWVNGMAGTGKSTISWTIAKWLANQGSHGIVDLGTSFFFKRGEGDRGSAALVFPTIAGQLAIKIAGLDVFLARAIDVDPHICNKALGEQFRRLIWEPLQNLWIRCWAVHVCCGPGCI